MGFGQIGQDSNLETIANHNFIHLLLRRTCMLLLDTGNSYVLPSQAISQTPGYARKFYKVPFTRVNLGHLKSSKLLQRRRFLGSWLSRGTINKAEQILATF